MNGKTDHIQAFAWTLNFLKGEEPALGKYANIVKIQGLFASWQFAAGH